VGCHAKNAAAAQQLLANSERHRTGEIGDNLRAEPVASGWSLLDGSDNPPRSRSAAVRCHEICSVSALLRRGAFVTHVFDPLTALLTLASQCLGLTQIKVSTCGNNKFALAEAEKWKSSLIKFPI
jgi:hypothetical protein